MSEQMGEFVPMPADFNGALKKRRKPTGGTPVGAKLAVTDVRSPGGRRHYTSGRRRFGMEITLCGIGIDKAMGWDKYRPRDAGRVDPECSRCLGKLT